MASHVHVASFLKHEASLEGNQKPILKRYAVISIPNIWTS